MNLIRSQVYRSNQHIETEPQSGNKENFLGEQVSIERSIKHRVQQSFDAAINDDFNAPHLNVPAVSLLGVGQLQANVLAIAGANTAPVVQNHILDINTNEDSLFNFVVPTNTFRDADLNDKLTLRVSLADGSPLPAWLSFDPTTGKFSGTPRNADVRSYDIKITATDLSGAAVSDAFRLTVMNTNDAPTTHDNQVQVVAQGTYTFQVSDFPFSDEDASALFWSIKLISLPPSGTLMRDGVPLALNTRINTLDIANGRFTYVAANSPNTVSSFQFVVNDGVDDSNTASFVLKINPVLVPTYLISTNVTSIDEGGLITYFIKTTNVDVNTALKFQLFGISVNDVDGAYLTGPIKLAQDGTASFSVKIKADHLTEGSESVVAKLIDNAGTVVGTTNSLTINDASKTPTFQIGSDVMTLDEGGTVKFSIKTTEVAAGTIFDYKLLGISAADVVQGTDSGKVVIDADGTAILAITFLADGKTEGYEIANLRLIGSSGETLALSPSVGINDTSNGYPAYTIALDKLEVNEGERLSVLVNTLNVPDGTQVKYFIRGASATDTVKGQDSGTVTVAGGQIKFFVDFAADQMTEGDEKFSVVLTSMSGSSLAESASITLHDTSKSAPVYKLSTGGVVVKEGNSITFTLETYEVPVGTSLIYKLSGIPEGDVVGGKLSEQFTVGDRFTYLPISIAEDNVPEPLESFVLSIFSVEGKLLAVSSPTFIRDLSIPIPSYTLTPNLVEISEGGVLTLTIKAKDYVPGGWLNYYVDGTGITYGDLATKALSGTVKLTGDATTFSIPIQADLLTEGTEIMTVRVSDPIFPAYAESVGIKIKDTSMSPIFGVTGTMGNDTLIGSVDNDVIKSLAGDDVVVASYGNDNIDCGDGFDTLVYRGKLKDFVLTSAGGTYQVKTVAYGTQTLSNVERLIFDDYRVNLTVQAVEAKAKQLDVHRIEELYVAFFNRVPDADGMEYWIGQLNAGKSVVQIAESFYGAGIAFSEVTGYTPSMTNSDFINLIYKNVLGRPDGADTEGLNYWSAQLTTGKASRGSLVVDILGSAHTFKGDATWGFVADLLDNKIEVAHKFSGTWGLSFLTDNESISSGMKIASLIAPNDTMAALTLIGINEQSIVWGA